MRKNYSKYFAFLFIFCFSFIQLSCSDDDDKVKIENITETTLQLNGVQQDLTSFNITSFDKDTKQLVVYFETSKSFFRMNFIMLDFKELKIGADLAKAEDFEYFLSLSNQQYCVLSPISDNLPKYKGTVRIMSVDKDKSTMSIKFSNLYLESRQESGKMMKVDGTIISKIYKY